MGIQVEGNHVVISRAKTAWGFRDELVQHLRKIAAVHVGAQRVLRTRMEQNMARAREREVTQLADFIAEIEFTEEK